MKQIVHHVPHPGSVGLTEASGTAASGTVRHGGAGGVELMGVGVRHDSVGKAQWSSSGGVRHGGGDREAESGMAATTRHGGAGRRQQLSEARHRALGMEDRCIGHGIELRARMSRAPVTATVVLR
jgi:hypothetical protein